MNNIVTIKGQPVLDIYETFDGSYWFVVEKAFKQDSLIRGRIFRNDQIFYGYTRLSMCSERAEFGYFSEAELKLLGCRAWKVPRTNWQFCPGVEVRNITCSAGKKDKSGCETGVSQPLVSGVCVEVDEK